MCVCKPGLVRLGERCVKPTECGCVVDHERFPMGSVVVQKNCTERCSCVKFGATSLDCAKMACDKHASCDNEDGVLACKCLKGFQGDGEQKCENVSCFTSDKILEASYYSYWICE